MSARPEKGAHTRTSTDVGPDCCAECSAAWQQWVKWPCVKEHAPFCSAWPGDYSAHLSCCRGARYHADAPVTAATNELAAARLVVAKHTCAVHGHDFGYLVATTTGAPVKVYCANGCGAGPWKVVPADE